MVSLPILFQKHLKRYELIKKALSPKIIHHRPVITISREPGSGGRLIAQLVAGKLGFDYYDRNLVDLVGKEGKLSNQIVKALDEQKRNNILAIIATLFGNDPLPNQAYIRALSKAILSIAAKGSAVILGRGANFIVSSKNSLNIRIIAPLQTRIKSNMRYDHVTEKEATASIRKIHFNRKNFIYKYFSKNVSNTNYYDLVINTKDMAVEDAADLVVNLYHLRWG